MKEFDLPAEPAPPVPLLRLLLAAAAVTACTALLSYFGHRYFSFRRSATADAHDESSLS